MREVVVGYHLRPSDVLCACYEQCTSSEPITPTERLRSYCGMLADLGPGECYTAHQSAKVALLGRLQQEVSTLSSSGSIVLAVVRTITLTERADVLFRKRVTSSFNQFFSNTTSVADCFSSREIHSKELRRTQAIVGDHLGRLVHAAAHNWMHDPCYPPSELAALRLTLKPLEDRGQQFYRDWFEERFLMLAPIPLTVTTPEDGVNALRRALPFYEAVLPQPSVAGAISHMYSSVSRDATASAWYRQMLTTVNDDARLFYHLARCGGFFSDFTNGFVLSVNEELAAVDDLSELLVRLVGRRSQITTLFSGDRELVKIVDSAVKHRLLEFGPTRLTTAVVELLTSFHRQEIPVAFCVGTLLPAVKGFLDIPAFRYEYTAQLTKRLMKHQASIESEETILGAMARSWGVVIPGARLLVEDAKVAAELSTLPALMKFSTRLCIANASLPEVVACCLMSHGGSRLGDAARAISSGYASKLRNRVIHWAGLRSSVVVLWKPLDGPVSLELRMPMVHWLVFETLADRGAAPMTAVAKVLAIAEQHVQAALHDLLAAGLVVASLPLWHVAVEPPAGPMIPVRVRVRDQPVAMDRQRATAIEAAIARVMKREGQLHCEATLSCALRNDLKDRSGPLRVPPTLHEVHLAVKRLCDRDLLKQIEQRLVYCP